MIVLTTHYFVALTALLFAWSGLGSWLYGPPKNARSIEAQQHAQSASSHYTESKEAARQSLEDAKMAAEHAGAAIKEKIQQVGVNVKDIYNQTATATMEAIKDKGQDARDVGGEVGEKTRETAASVGHGLKETVEWTKEMAQQAAEWTKHKAYKAGHKASDIIHRMRHRLTEPRQWEEDPGLAVRITPDAYFIMIDVPGIALERIKVHVARGQVHVYGQHEECIHEEYFGTGRACWERIVEESFDLPEDADQGKIGGWMVLQVLVIRIPRLPVVPDHIVTVSASPSKVV